MEEVCSDTQTCATKYDGSCTLDSSSHCPLCSMMLPYYAVTSSSIRWLLLRFFSFLFFSCCCSTIHSTVDVCHYVGSVTEFVHLFFLFNILILTLITEQSFRVLSRSTIFEWFNAWSFPWFFVINKIIFEKKLFLTRRQITYTLLGFYVAKVMGSFFPFRLSVFC